MGSLLRLTAFLAAAANALLFVAFRAQEDEEIDDGLSGFTGWTADVIVELGEFGVGLFVFIETVFPPIPSEIILSLSGYLAERGRMNVFLVVVAATIGSVAGAWFLYALGAWFGEPRAKSWLVRLPLVEMSDAMRAEHLELKRFLREHLYRHYRVQRMTRKARTVVQELFRVFMDDLLLMPDEHRASAQRMESEAGQPGRARAVADYVAGMTDRFAITEHDRLFVPAHRS